MTAEDTINGTSSRGKACAAMFASCLAVCAAGKVALNLQLGASPLGTACVLPGALFGDIIFSFFVAAASGYAPRLSRAAIFFTAAIYSFNILYAPFGRTLIDRSALIYAERLGSLAGSIGDVVEFKGLVLAALPLLVAAVLSPRRIAAWLAAIKRPIAAAAAATAIWLVLALIFRPPADISADAQQMPLLALFSSAKEMNSAEPAAIAPLDSAPPFSQPDYPALPGLSGKAKGMNVILIIGESLSGISLRRPGTETMPGLSGLARNGISFDRFYATTVLTIKSLFAIHTGLYPAPDFSWISHTRPHFPVTMLPQFFKNAGYKTAYFSSEFEQFNDDFNFLNAAGYDLLMDGKPMADAAGGPGVKSLWGIDDRITFKRALEWAKSADGPFFLTVFPVATHNPYVLPDAETADFPGESRLDRYHSAARYLDRQISAFRDGLKAGGLLESTIIVVVGDHGEDFGQHDNNISHSTGVYEESVRVPCIISNPKLFNAPLLATRPASLVDLFPTLLDLAGIASDSQPRDGVALGSAGSQPRLIFTSAHLGRDSFGVIDGDTKFIQFVSRTGAEKNEMYNLAADPEEKNNLADPEPAKVEQYRRKIAAWRLHALDVQNKTAATSSGEAIRLTALPIVFSAQDRWTFKIDRNVMGREFEIAGKKVPAFGIGTHANSIITFDTSAYRGYVFQTQVGRDTDGWGGEASAHAEIWIDGAPVFQTPELTSESGVALIRIPVTGGRLSLVINRTKKAMLDGNQFDWIEPVLLPK